jgi:hypothetical protein
MVDEQRNRLIPRFVGALFRLHLRIFSIVMPPKCFVEGLGPWFPISGMERIRRRTPGFLRRRGCMHLPAKPDTASGSRPTLVNPAHDLIDSVGTVWEPDEST